MKRIFPLVALLCVIFSLSNFAQTAIPNGAFENWVNVGSSTEEPQYWHSNEDGGGYAPLGPQTCFQETSNPHGGTYCVRQVSASYFGQTVNSSCTTGQVEAPTLTKADGFIRSESTNTGYLSAFTGRPDSLVFWYRYTSAGSDYPTVEVRLHVDSAYAPETPSNSNHPNTSYDIIARALWAGPASSVSGWTRVSLPFVYADGRTPQYILITSTASGNQTGGTSGSTLWLDDMVAIYNPTIATGTVSTGPVYVSASAGANINVPFTLTGTYNAGNVITAQLSNASGSFASPVNIGTLTTTSSGTVSATIPANTATGAGYRIRVVASNPLLTATDNGSNISIILTSNSVAPSGTQNIAANINGTGLTVTETPAATSRTWISGSTVSGPFTSLTGSGITYTPNFAAAGTYYVACVSSYPGLNDTSNFVRINVVSNSIAPTSPQSLLVGVNGNLLTVTETPAGTARVWAYSHVSGGPYSPILPLQTSTTYTPNFSSAGTYYVVCVSIINSDTATSNQVLVSVGAATIATGTVNGSPYLFSAHAPDANVSVPYTTSGTFNNGNIFTAQLSDATGSFSSPTNIGTLAATSSANINAVIPHTTPAGSGYRIRVISSSPVVLGSDNGVDLTVDQFNNSIAPVTTQTIMYNTNGTALTVTASQTGSQQWKYSTTSGSGYLPFTPVQTGSSYTPNFALPGTYYIVCVSKNAYDSITSNQLQVNVLNGDTIITSAVSGSPYLVSDSAHVQVTVNFTSNVIFNAGNVFTAQLSDNTGSFSNPVTIGSLAATTVGGIQSVIPNSSVAGSNYRIRVVSSNPAFIGSDNGTDLQIIPFSISLSTTDTQTVVVNTNGNPINVTSSQPATYDWQNSQASGIGYIEFTPAQHSDTLIPNFGTITTFYVICNVTNAVHATLRSPEVVFIVTTPNGINNVAQNIIKAYWDHNNFVVDLNAANLTTPVLQLYDITGQVIAEKKLTAGRVNQVYTNAPQGIYMFRIIDGENVYSGKTPKK